MKKASKSSAPDKPRVHYAHRILYSQHPVNIGIVGVGGTGSMVIRELARMNTALHAMDHPGLHVLAFDPDTVSEANIGRQLFTEDDIGVNKAVALITHINRAWGTSWDGYPSKFTQNPVMPTVVISCTDTIDSRRKLENIAYSSFTRTNDNIGSWLYWIDAGNGLDYGQVMVGTTKNIRQPKSELYSVVGNLGSPIQQYKNVPENKDEPSCSLAQALGKQDLFINSMMAQAICQMLWSLIHKKFLVNKGAYINLERMKMQPVPV